MTTENLINFTLDGNTLAVPKGTTVYQAAKKLGIDIPIFCYQDRMPPFGACRMCLVQVEKMGKLQTSCTLEATEGMVVHTQSQTAVEGREGILELLLINHPLDCPICDRGGECPLQDQTLKHGPGKSRFFEDKRRFVKPLPLGPVLMLDRERCIICARCTRFGDLIAGDNALEMKDRGYQSEVGTPDELPVESKFIGNTIKLCPVGALTSQVYRFRARPWDNDVAPTTCTLCPVGCSMLLDSRDGEIVRTRSKENKDVNDLWMCDKGWFGYEFATHPHRLEKPMMRENGELVTVEWEKALTFIARKMEEARPGGKIAGLGGNPLTTEENDLFQQLIRKGGGTNHVDHRVGMPLLSLDDELIPPGMEMSIGECEELSSAFLFGVDLTEEFPVIWLRLKQAINRGAKVSFFGHYAPEISRHLLQTVLHAPGEELNVLRQHAASIKEMIVEGKKGAVFVGRQYLANPQRRLILNEIAAIIGTGSSFTLNIMEGSGNSMGARYAGMRPDLGPAGEKLVHPGLNVIQVIEEAAHNGWDFLYIAGSNISKQFPKKLWEKARENLKCLVVQDLFLNETAFQADVLLPALSFLEKEGSFINIEQRVQKIHPGKIIEPELYSDGEIFQSIARHLQIELEAAPTISSLNGKERLPLMRHFEPFNPAEVSSNSSAGNLKAVFVPALFDEGVRMKHDTHLIKLVKSPKVKIHPKDGEKHGVQSGEQVHLFANGESISAVIKWDSKVAEGGIVIPLGFAELPVYEWGAELMNGLPIEIRKGHA
ncbi:MAG: NADH-quinone oxidoreductase subunit NuoG [Candidatus Protochlamydia sp.]|nr:NADH-quinone oxidoreductase subunit NuoG [Candidatus Protochlamydia sp.]